ncbi:MAG: hypothetical protein KDD44_11140 [Bdellovibrionales bacterium]|nr:hypothetical protein [Bdellovibrionales bacterium]
MRIDPIRPSHYYFQRAEDERLGRVAPIIPVQPIERNPPRRPGLPLHQRQEIRVSWERLFANMPKPGLLARLRGRQTITRRIGPFVVELSRRV